MRIEYLTIMPEKLRPPSRVPTFPCRVVRHAPCTPPVRTLRHRARRRTTRHDWCAQVPIRASNCDLRALVHESAGNCRPRAPLACTGAPARHCWSCTLARLDEAQQQEQKPRQFEKSGAGMWGLLRRVEEQAHLGIVFRGSHGGNCHGGKGAQQRFGHLGR